MAHSKPLKKISSHVVISQRISSSNIGEGIWVLEEPLGPGTITVPG